ncbi:MAG: glycosyltransferase family 4 protein [Alphaproteobacteria bacterium]|nr:glycosyltransferase family 4 protein [Alphaproteobacteria bacterium]
MKVHYISPSTLPSRAANSVHVVMQCEALANAGAEVVLYARRAMKDAGKLPEVLRETYGVNLPGGKIISFFSASGRGTSLIIAAMALYHMRFGNSSDAILSRNLYASFLFGVLKRRSILFETHQLEVGWKKVLQRMIMTRPWVTTVVISKRLAECLEEHHGIRAAKFLVLHDAAPEGGDPLPVSNRRAVLNRLIPETVGSWDAVCGYFGHLYQGRGIEVIEGMAAARPRCLFLVFGGTDADLERLRLSNRSPNLRFMGHVPHVVAQRVMRSVDVLLMPYQEKVAIGVLGHDTARWMSPMKMFEYMASGVALISSDLPVLGEVLTRDVNALLAAPSDVRQWIAALDRLIASPELALSVSKTAYEDYKANYTWSIRAKRLMDAAIDMSRL